MEKWIDIKDYEGLYCISDKGRVKSLRRKRINGGLLIERILKPRYDKMGYVQYVLNMDGIKKSVKGHHLVFEHFSDLKRDGRRINIDHIDENKSNNTFENLRLLTNRQNLSKGKIKKNKSSIYTGVYKPKGSDKFQAYITINKKHIYLGLFDSEIEAHKAYINAIPECEK